MIEIDRVAAEFWRRVAVGEPDECWPWRLSRQRKGYAQWAPPRASRLAGGRRVSILVHRLAWLITRGPIPPGWTVDHRCRLRWCCNPAHLKLATVAQNCSDNAFARRTRCPAGHPYDDANTERVGAKQYRRCITCRRERARRKA